MGFLIGLIAILFVLGLAALALTMPKMIDGRYGKVIEENRELKQLVHRIYTYTSEKDRFDAGSEWVRTEIERTISEPERLEIL